MAKLVSAWSKLDQSLPENYIFPPETRPGKSVFPLCDSIPVVDLSQAVDNHNRSHTIQQILKASMKLGFFQVINHGVPEKLMKDTMSVFEEFFEMPVDVEQKSSLYTEDFTKRSCKLFTSGRNYNHEKIHYWRDGLSHPCHPSEECTVDWPTTPFRYRDIVGAYSVEVRKLASTILVLIAEGLGLESGYFGDKLSGSPAISVSHYPPCPDPRLTLGIPKHCDPNLITILLQDDVSGLQVFKNGEWMTVQPLPNAFMINVGYILQILSNDKLKGGVHRVVTNSQKARTSAAFFISPTDDCIIDSKRASTNNASNRPLYRPFQYKEFVINYSSKGGNEDTILEYIVKQ